MTQSAAPKMSEITIGGRTLELDETDPRLKSGSVVHVGSLGHDEAEVTMVRKAAGNQNPTPTFAFQKYWGLGLATKVFKGTQQGLSDIAKGMKHLGVGTASGTVSIGVGVAGYAAAACGTAFVGMGLAGMAVLDPIAEMHGSSFAVDYPTLVEVMKGVGLAGAAAGAGKLSLLHVEDRTWDFAEKCFTAPIGNDDRTAMGHIRSGLRKIADSFSPADPEPEMEAMTGRMVC